MYTIGVSLSDLNCDLNSIQDISEIPTKNKELILLRSNLQRTENATVCFIHKEHFLYKYNIYQQKCCDLFNIHPNKARKISLRAISVQRATVFKTVARCKHSKHSKVSGHSWPETLLCL